MRVAILVAIVVLNPWGFGGLQAQASSSVPPLPCFASDSGRIAYGEILTAPGTGDHSGVQFSFAVQDGRLRGWVRDARGELPRERALDSLAVTAQGDSLYFSYRSSGTRYTYWVQVSCAGLQGGARLFETNTSPGVVRSFAVERARWIAKP